MEQVHIFLDNSNLWIEGQRKAANPLAPTRHKNGSFRLDFGELLAYVSKGRKIKEARLYGSEPPPNDTVWEKARKEGFTVNVNRRSVRGKEKQVDTQMCVDITKAIYLNDPKERTLIILAGDRDYVPTFKEAKNRNWNIEVYFWSNASAEIKKHPDIKFIDFSRDLLKVGFRAIRK